MPDTVAKVFLGYFLVLLDNFTFSLRFSTENFLPPTIFLPPFIALPNGFIQIKLSWHPRQPKAGEGKKFGYPHECARVSFDCHDSYNLPALPRLSKGPPRLEGKWKIPGGIYKHYYLIA
jgi:hypothetical protein